MNCREIQRRLLSDRSRRSTVMPNYTPVKWWECDVFEMTQAGFFREYEIKISRSDFKADAAKDKTIWSLNSEGWSQSSVNKHRHLTERSTAGPSQFWFVTPQDLITTAEVPEWAGLIWMVRSRFLVEQKKAPRLHNQKLDPEVRNSVYRTAYYRFHSFLARNPKMDIPTESADQCKSGSEPPEPVATPV